MTERVAVIIVNYGTVQLTLQAVESVLIRDHGERQVDIHVVDNASPGDDAAVLKSASLTSAWSSRVTLWLETENHGFGRGNNVVLKALAAQETPPSKVFLLNPDARLDNEVIDILAQTLDQNPRAAAAGGGIVKPDMTPSTAAFRFPGPVNELASVIDISILNRQLRNRLMLLPPDHAAGPVDWVSGASVMFRFDAICEVDFFDPEFFLYYEEVDLMRRLRDAGWQVLYEPRARVVHEEGAATGQFGGTKGRRRIPDYLYQSWTYYFSRAYGRAGALVLALTMWPVAVLNILHRGVRGQAPTIPHLFFRDHWRHVIQPLTTGSRERKETTTNPSR